MRANHQVAAAPKDDRQIVKHQVAADDLSAVMIERASQCLLTD